RIRRRRSKRSASGLNTRAQDPLQKRPQRSIEMKGNAKDYVSTAQQFFTAYDAHDVDCMLGLCANGALGRYAWLLHHSVVILPIPGTSSVAHLEENMKAAHLALTEAE